MKTLFYLILVMLASCEEIRLTSRNVLTKRLSKYFYFSTKKTERMLDQINKTDKNALNEVLVFDEDPETIDIFSGDQICISNTFFSLLFTILTFSSACSVIVAC